jgi:triacylglycerol esterase/lipase EstA (alpha/beta hydrolase family)
MSRHHVILIPGFFAFAGLGELRYWSGVDVALKRAFEAYELHADIIEIETLPTASIRFRAARVLEAIERVCQIDDGPIHLIGHSTGGLDARLAVIPTAALPTSADIKACKRVASIVTIATPHHGTPLAGTFGSAMGQPILRWLSSTAVVGLEQGQLPLSGLLRVGALIVRLDDIFGLKQTVVDQLYEQLFNEFTDDRRKALIAFLEQVACDRALIVQLTPDSLDLFNATTADPDIDFGCVITRGARPTWRRVVAQYHDAYAQSLYGLYSLLWLITSRLDERYLPVLTEQQELALVSGYGALPKATDNDGMSPTLSQVWGEIIHVADADHLDVMGQYGDLTRPGIHADWLPSGSGFDGVKFNQLWSAVAAFVTRKARGA